MKQQQTLKELRQAAGLRNISEAAIELGLPVNRIHQLIYRRVVPTPKKKYPGYRNKFYDQKDIDTLRTKLGGKQ